MLFIPHYLEAMVWVISSLGLTMLWFSIMRLKAEKKAGLPTDRTRSIIIGSIISSVIGLGLVIMTVFADM